MTPKPPNTRVRKNRVKENKYRIYLSRGVKLIGEKGDNLIWVLKISCRPPLWAGTSKDLSEDPLEK